MQRLRGLIPVAMIGTERSGGGAGEPANLLRESAKLGIQARAGWKPPVVSGEVSLSPIDPRPVASPAAMATLTRLLLDSDASLIREWAELAQATGVRIDDSLVPSAMDWWARQPKRSEVVHAALGTHGEWLASMNPAWQKPVASADVPVNADELWHTGKAAERQAILATVRRHDPARARAMIEATWQSDGADERRRFVESLLYKCSMDDEPFLEAALDDKSKTVRKAAAAVLSDLPGSGLRMRMSQRAQAIISVETKRSGLKRTVKISLTPPDKFDKAWERDGLEEQAASGTGKRAWWMGQILATTDLSAWTELCGLPPEGVLESLSGDDYFDNALHAIAQSVRVTRDHAWCIALVRAMLERPKTDVHSFQWLWQSLPLEQREPLLLEIARHRRFDSVDRWMILATGAERWSAGFSTAALKILGTSAPRKPQQAWQLHEAVETVSRFVAPAAVDEFETTITAMFPAEPTDSFKKSIDRLRLRAEMHKEFAS